MFSDIQFRRGFHTDFKRTNLGSGSGSSNNLVVEYNFIERFDKVSLIGGINFVVVGQAKLSLTAYGGLEKTVSRKVVASEDEYVSYHRTDSPVVGAVFSVGI